MIVVSLPCSLFDVVSGLWRLGENVVDLFLAVVNYRPLESFGPNNSVAERPTLPFDPVYCRAGRAMGNRNGCAQGNCRWKRGRVCFGNRLGQDSRARRVVDNPTRARAEGGASTWGRGWRYTQAGMWSDGHVTRACCWSLNTAPPLSLPLEQ